MEKGISIADQTGGVPVATRDALETTESESSRVIQLVDFASRQLGRVAHRSGLTGADGADVATVAGLSSAKITVGDKSTLVVHCEVSPAANFKSCILTPVVYDSSGVIVGILQSKQTGIGDVTIYNGIGQGKGLLPALAWDVYGAPVVSVHVTAVEKTGAILLNLYAGVI